MDETEYDIYADLDDFNLSEQVKEVCAEQTAWTICISRLFNANISLPEKYAHFQFGREITIGGRNHFSARTEKSKP